MYGLVNRAIEGLIVDRHGEEVWERILERAGVDEPTFIGLDPYPDELTYSIVAAASEELSVPAESLLEAFGEYWMTYTAKEGYGELLELSGRTFEEFLGNLDPMHARIALMFPDLEPPSFRCSKDSEGVLELHYMSDRPGLAPMVIGLVRGVAARFDERVDIHLVHPNETGVEHDVFRITTRT